MIGSQAADQPHHLDVAACLTFQAGTALHPIEITADVKLQKDCRMIGRPVSLARHIREIEGELKVRLQNARTWAEAVDPLKVTG
jgi:hypothetical protein